MSANLYLPPGYRRGDTSEILRKILVAGAAVEALSVISCASTKAPRPSPKDSHNG